MAVKTKKIALTTCLWFNKNAEAAARFYAKTFPNTRITKVFKSPADYPNGKAGNVLTVEFTLLGQSFVAMNGGPGHPLTDAISFQVFTKDQKETDRYWATLTKNGGKAIACGWCRDKFGLSWQIVPRALMQGMYDKDRKAAKRVMQAMMGMVKIDIKKIEKARRGGAARKG